MIYPIFVCPGTNVRHEIASMPGQYNLSIDNAVKIARDAESAGIAETEQEAAAKAAGFEAANRIGPYLRTLINSHHDTLAVSVK